MVIRLGQRRARSAISDGEAAMREVLRDRSPSALVAAIEANTIGYYLSYGHVAGTEIHDDPALLWFSTGLPIEEFNGVLRADLPPGSADALIDGLLARFRERQLPLLWHIGPSSRPAELGQLLLAHGLTHYEDEPGMAADLHTLDERAATPPGLRIEPVGDAATFRAWLRVWAYDVPEAALEPHFTLYSALGLGAPHPLRHYLGVIDGRPVATAALFEGAGVVSVQHVVTLPGWRRQGIGTAMTLYVARQARAAGYEIAVLTASPQGRPSYERIGFRTYCQLSRFRWRPHPAPP